VVLERKSPVTYSEAIEIMRYAQKKIRGPATLTQAMILSQYDFPLEEKFRVIDRVCKAYPDIKTLFFFREAFRQAESDYHKGNPPKRGDLARVSDILGIKDHGVGEK
jgi:hypothetical protein